jgi:hypothetical protein
MNTEHAEIIWCCSQFEMVATSCGRRGFSIAIGAEFNGDLFFMMQGRMFDENDTARAAEMSPVMRAIKFEQGIRHCPWCGVNLKEYYQEYARRIPITYKPG